MDPLAIAMPAPEQLSALAKAAGREFVWGTAENDQYLWNGNVLGTVGVVRLGWWVERLPPRYADRIATWKVLTICAEAQDRYHRHLLGLPTESLDLEAILHETLRVQKDWIVWAERDADQEPLLFTAMRPTEIVSEVRRLMLFERGARPFVAWPKEESKL